MPAVMHAYASCPVRSSCINTVSLPALHKDLYGKDLRMLFPEAFRLLLVPLKLLREL